MILHVLKKDVRRLWPAIGVSLVVLGSLAWHDRWRSDWIAGATEGYLNVLTPLVWALLLGLVVEQEPIAGDRQFWLTRPYSRGSLLAAKLLFALLFVHAPSLIADCYILTARGFSPGGYLPELLGKQALLAAALTIPAMALASLVRNFAHFVLEVVGVAAAVLLLSGALESGHYAYTLWEPLSTVRREAAILVAAAASAVVLAMQYLGRRVAWSRGLAAVAGLSAAALFVWFLPQTALAIRAASRPAPATPAIAIDPSPRRPTFSGNEEKTVHVPIAVTGFPEGTTWRLDLVRSEIEGAGGLRYGERMSTRPRPYDRRPYRAGIWRLGVDETSSHTLFLGLAPAVFGGLQNAPVTLRGEIAGTVIRTGESVWMGVGESRVVPGAGRCTTEIVEDRFTRRIKLVCESPRSKLAGTRARVWSPTSGREWKTGLGDARRYGIGSRLVWLSPLDRDQAYWDIGTEPALPLPSDRFRVPASEAASVRIEVMPLEIVGYASIPFELRGIDLKQYLAKPPPNRAGAR
jgi:hypothetical protein